MYSTKLQPLKLTMPVVCLSCTECVVCPVVHSSCASQSNLCYGIDLSVMIVEFPSLENHVPAAWREVDGVRDAKLSEWEAATSY